MADTSAIAIYVRIAILAAAGEVRHARRPGETGDDDEVIPNHVRSAMEVVAYREERRERLTGRADGAA